MKKFILSLFLFTLTTVSVSADFVDYGKDSKGRLCASSLKGDGTCNIIYSNDVTLRGDGDSFDVHSSAYLAQPNAPTMKILVDQQKATRAWICNIIVCPVSGSNYNK